MTLRAKHLSAGLAFLLSGTMLSGLAHAQDSGPAAATESDAIVIVGKGQTRSVSTLVRANLDALPRAPACRSR